jgi:hypothetical protein
VSDIIGINTTNTIAGQFVRVIVGGYDLTEFLISLSTRRALSSPVGSWTINLRPIIRNGSVCDLPIKVNDYCEIRAGRYKNKDGLPPLLMRGLVDGISLKEDAAQSDEGTVSRMVTIGGSDLGKLFKHRQIRIPVDGATEEAYAALYAYIKDFLITRKVDGTKASEQNFEMSMTKWLELFYSKVYDLQYVQKIANATDTGSFTLKPVLDIPKNKSGDDRFRVLATPLINSFQGSLWDFISFYCKPPFFEIFLDDEETETRMYTRWTPYLSTDATKPSQGSNGLTWNNIAIGEIQVGYNTVISQEFRRNDFDRATYFLTDFDQSWISGSNNSKQTLFVDFKKDSATPGAMGGTHRNPYFDEAGMRQFGYKPMVVKLPFYGSTSNGGQIQIEIPELLRDCTKWLVDVFGAVDRLYNGQMVFVGNPEIHIGKWLLLGKDSIRLYVESVEHSISVFPSPNFVTRINFTRGEGFDPTDGGGRTVHPKYLRKVNFTQDINILGIAQNTLKS